MKNNNYDVFLSFAVKDRAELVHPLLLLLQKRGLKVWYSSDELSIGESLQRTILSGLERSRFGLFLITPNSINQSWPTNELNAMWSLSGDKKNTLLPVLHGVKMEEAVAKYPILKDRWFLNTEKGMEYIAKSVAERVKQHRTRSHVKITKNILILLLFACVIGLLGFREYGNHTLYNAYSSTEHENLRLILNKRIDRFTDREAKRKSTGIRHNGAKPVLEETALKLCDEFSRLDARYRNTYEYSTPRSYYQSKKHVEPAAGIDFDTLSAKNNYGFRFPLIELIDNGNNENKFRHTITYYNTQPIT
ncbi:MAG: toll/interleukin-1 receptor domain-containing protein, partial [Cyclobacteriaceae bacterium]